MDMFLTWIAVLLFAPMVLGPFLVKFSHRISARFSIQTVPPENLDPAIRAFLDKSRIEFESIGFEFVGYMSLSDYIPKISSYFALFTDKQSKASAMTAVIRHTSGRTALYNEFTQKYSNGRIINVSNSPTRGSFINPEKSSYRYPKVQSVGRLYEIHKWITSHDRKATGPVGFEKGREMEMLSEALSNELRLQGKYGRYYLTEDGSRYKPTWKGAFIMTEKQAFPIKQILNALDLAAAEKAIAGMPASPAEQLNTEGTSQAGAGDFHQRGGGPGGGNPAAAKLKLEHRFKTGANWFFWIAALSLVNSLAMKFGSSWHFVIGLGITELIDAIALSLLDRTDMAFQAILFFMDAGFAALFLALGILSRKGSADVFLFGIIFYGIDSLLFLLAFDLLGIAFHAVSLVFLYRGWAALKKMNEPSGVQDVQPA